MFQAAQTDFLVVRCARASLAGLISFVPTIGAVLAIVLALLVAFQQDPWTPFYVLVLFVAIQAVEINLLTPLMQLSIPPVVLVVSQVLMGILVGIVGVAVATPLAAVVLQVIRELYVREPDAMRAESTSVELA